jgi:MazG family protein
MTNDRENPDGFRSGIEHLLWVVARLRGDNGCPWDREQTLETLKPFLVEECYELLDAMGAPDPASHCEELGDVLLQVVLQSQLRSEQGQFSFDDVAGGIARKLIRRHPHVFGESRVDDAQGVIRQWEVIKATEKPGGRRGLFDGVPRELPALQKAQRVQSRAARVGFDWADVRDVMAKVEEELRETRSAMECGTPAEVREEIGDLMFSVVNLCRFLEVDAEDALRATIGKFMGRFGEMQRRIEASGRSLTECSLAEMDAVWNAVKQEARVPVASERPDAGTCVSPSASL